MDDSQWTTLMERIASGRCTPFLGAGACWPTLPRGRDIAERWTEAHGYPLGDPHDLARVSQYLAVLRDPMYPKERISQELASLGPPDFGLADEPHAVLADLPLPLYITTNYDDFMARALVQRGRAPQQEVCRWNDSYYVHNDTAPLASDPAHLPTPANPIVFHLHGRLGIPESLVLTEDDYLDFLVALSERRDGLLPHQVRGALSSTSLMFIGYALADWDFRVLHRGLVTRSDPSLRRVSVTVQLRQAPEAEDYLANYFKRMDVAIYWGDATSFARDLRDRWESFRSAEG
jgi:SIR2-like domain